MLNISDGIENMGQVEWKLILFLFLAWVLTFACVIKGIKSTGKVKFNLFLISKFTIFVNLLSSLLIGTLLHKYFME